MIWLPGMLSQGCGLPLKGKALNDCTWDEISQISTAGKGPEYFSVGDIKEIVINGTVGATKLSNISLCAFIIGFDHNATIEGTERIHFQIGCYQTSDGKRLCFDDSNYNKQMTSESGVFYWGAYNNQAKYTYGWENCNMRKNILGGDRAPDSPKSNTFMTALPSELRAVLKPCVKYTANFDSAGNRIVSATTDYLWLLSEFEMAGTRVYADPNEQTQQAQYAWYMQNGLPKFYKYNATGTVRAIWTRSLQANYGNIAAYLGSSGSFSSQNVRYSLGISPALCV